MISHRIRAAAALPLALVVSAILQVLLIHLVTLNVLGGSIIGQFWQSLATTFVYGLPLGLAAMLATEFLRERRAVVYVVSGTALTFLAAHLATRNESVTSYVFTGGALTPLGLLASGILASAAYWALAGRRAGWRGEEAESDYAHAAQAYKRASERHSKSEICRPCLFAWVAASAAAFGLFAWIAIDVAGLREGLLVTAEREGRAALKTSGYAWANFHVSGSLGSMAGDAPDELEKRSAFDTVREALNAATGFPGLLSRIDDKSVAQVPMAAIAQSLAEAKLREQQANQAIEDAKRMAELARASAADIKRQADEQALAAEAERKEMRAQQTEVQKLAAAATQSAAAAAAQSAAATAPQQAAAAAPQQAPAAAPAQPAPPANAQQNAAPSSATVQEASLSTGGGAEAPTAEAVGAAAPVKAAPGATCTDQDEAMVESSHVHFAPQTFEIAAAYQRDLDLMAASVETCQPRNVLVTGYSDANADSLFNPALGLQRAEAVRDGLIARGVNAGHISIRSAPSGFGGDTTLAADDRATFRRTDFKLLEGTELSRDATQRPDERAKNCEGDLSEIMSQSIIHFPIASARVGEESAGLITKLAGAIQNCGSVIVTVEGHTDKIGTPERNQQLSIARANAVREALVAVGADPTRLASRGFASTRPFANEETAEAFALNRRIEFKVSGKFTSTNAGGP